MAEYMTKLMRALAHDKRQRILDWLREPRAHFLPQVDGDLIEDGVCVVFIAKNSVSANRRRPCT